LHNNSCAVAASPIGQHASAGVHDASHCAATQLGSCFAHRQTQRMRERCPSLCALVGDVHAAVGALFRSLPSSRWSLIRRSTMSTRSRCVAGGVVQRAVATAAAAAHGGAAAGGWQRNSAVVRAVCRSQTPSKAGLCVVCCHVGWGAWRSTAVQHQHPSGPVQRTSSSSSSVAVPDAAPRVPALTPVRVCHTCLTDV
jgi:hypothetical protein